MYLAGMMFHMMIGEILLSRGIMKSEEFLGFSIKQPKVAHLHGSRTLALDHVVQYPYSGGVDDVYGDGWLGVPHFFKG